MHLNICKNHRAHSILHTYSQNIGLTQSQPEVTNHPGASTEQPLKSRPLRLNKARLLQSPSKSHATHLVDHHDDEVDARQVLPRDVVDVPRAPLGQVALSVHTLRIIIEAKCGRNATWRML